MAGKDRVLNPAQALDLAETLYRENRPAEAEKVCRQLLRLRPENGAVLNLLGLCRLAQDDGAGAAERFVAALAAVPGDADFAVNLGRALEVQSKFDQAAVHYEGLVDDHPDHGPAWHRRGAVLRRLGRREDACNVLARAVALTPDDLHVSHDYASALFDIGRFEEAEKLFAAAQVVRPEVPAFAQGRSLALYEMGRFDDARAVLVDLIRDHPDFVDGLIVLAVVERRLGAYEESRRHLEHAHRLRPGDPEVLGQLGNTLRGLGRFGEALAMYDRALTRRADHVAANYDRSRLLILLGRVEEGYAAYDHWRWPYYRARRRAGRSFPQPKWDGGAFNGKHVLVWGEQGVGDEVMYGQMLATLTDEAARCTVECDARLVPLFERSFPAIRFFARGNPPAADLLDRAIDVQVPLLSLCRRFHPGPDRPSPTGGYLHADAAIADDLRGRYGGGKAPFLVGFSWSSGNRKAGRERSIGLDAWLAVFRQPGVRFVNLQYGDHGAEMREFADRHGLDIVVDDSVDPLADLDGFAAQVAAMDLVISIDNSTVHMAGALGRPVWMMLPLAPDPRWQIGRADTPWYATMRLFRQDGAGDWAAVIAAVADALAAEIRTRRR